MCEIDKYAVKSYNAIHGTNFGTSDITKIHAEDLGIVDTDKYTYVLTYSFPCGLAGTKIKVEDGYKSIEEVSVGDYVLTHTNTYKRVMKTMRKTNKNGYNKIKALGVAELLLTDEHPLYVLRNGNSEWVKVKDLKTTDYVCFQVNQQRKRIMCDNRILWLLGRYAADGHINKYTYNSVNFSIAYEKEKEFLDHVPEEMLPKFRKTKKSCFDYRIADEDFQELCYECGVGSTNKRVPQWILDAPVDQAKAFLDGYLSGDGHERTHGKVRQMMFSTTSKELFLGIQQLVAKVNGVICSCYLRHDNRKDTFNDSYNAQYSLSGKCGVQIVRGDKIYTPIREIEHIDEVVEVFNLEVETDNSYTCENVVVHNCQDLSNAGKQKGMTKGSGTRSGLLWEVERLLRECDELPQILLMENVPQVHGKKNLADFCDWIDTLYSFGYCSKYKDLNAKDYGIPQNRNRCFMISWIGNNFYDFSKGKTLEIYLKDVLEDKVDEKYYLSDETVNKFLEQSGNPSICLPQLAYCIDANYYKGQNWGGYTAKHRRQLVWEVKQLEPVDTEVWTGTHGI